MVAAKLTPKEEMIMKRMFALALVALFASACAPGQAKRWFNPGHRGSASIDR
jgi:hypothetical protein